MTLRAIGLLLILALATPAAALETRRSVQGFAGQMTDNEWGDLLGNFDSIRGRDAYQLGGGVGIETPLGRFGHLGVELNVLKHFGENTHFEVTLPFVVRTPRTRWAYVPSIAYGLGISHGTDQSETEIARTGSSARTLAHWFLEAEFGSDESAWRPFLRIHHRSDAWGAFDADTGSNAVLLGVRVPLD